MGIRTDIEAVTLADTIYEKMYVVEVRHDVPSVNAAQVNMISADDEKTQNAIPIGRSIYKAGKVVSNALTRASTTYFLFMQSSQ